MVGDIYYRGDPPDQPSGRLIYGKALVTDDAPWDVQAYAAKDARFPATPTSDQLFSGETFDAYQALGRHVGRGCARAVAGVAQGDGAGAPPAYLDLGTAGGPTAAPTR